MMQRTRGRYRWCCRAPGNESHDSPLSYEKIWHLCEAVRLDLDADDVVSFPFEALEFAAKIRTQLRQKQPELKFEAELKDALEREHLAESTAANLISKVMSRRRFWVLSIVCVLSAATLLAAVTTVISNRRSRKDTLQLNAT